jgi:AP-1 complex subunit beta-1
MGCLRVKKLNEYLGEPLKDALSDEDPYVRKTAVLCVPKVYELNPELVENAGMIDIMQKMLQKENNALVVSNLVVAMREISDLK